LDERWNCLWNKLKKIVLKQGNYQQLLEVHKNKDKLLILNQYMK